jgi:RNA polymerase sigma-70 factor (ECF subfamily)
MSPIVGRRPRANPNAFATEVLGFLEPLYATALRLTRNRADAEDLVQDTLVKALRFSGRYERGTNLRAWLSTILHNTWKNRLRDASRDRVEVDSARVDEASVGSGGPRVSETPEQMLIRESLDADLRRALDDVPDVFRQAVWMRDVEEFSYAEIARALDVPLGTVMSRISRGRRLVLERLRQRRADDGRTDVPGSTKMPLTTPV